MLRRLNDLQNYELAAQDGALGAVHDVYFDDTSWTVRYLVADTGGWLPGQKVLISPIAIGRPDPTRDALPVHLTKKQIENRPPIESDRPVSRQYEMEYYRYFGWPYYWVGGALWGYGPYATDLMSQTPSAHAEQRDTGDPNLRSAVEVTGYHFEGIDGEIGHVEDFVIEDRTWTIPYVILDTRNWWPGGKKVLISRHWLDEIRWADRAVRIGLSQDQVQRAPGFDPLEPIERSYEIALFNHYGRDLVESRATTTA